MKSNSKIALLLTDTKISKVVEFDKTKDKVLPLDFTGANKNLNSELLADTPLFTDWVKSELQKAACRYGVGGYNEHRTIYRRSELFDTANEPRRLHLGADIWGPVATTIYTPIDGFVHSFNFNDNFGDYGATIILEHRYPETCFYTLYGHLSLASIAGLQEGLLFEAGSKLAELGDASENGGWPPHLHFQLIQDMQGLKGDYPGVCKFSEREQYLKNSPDPNIILCHTFE
ncbi:peptidoglycan DD-metalloendopeptidase family protein [Pedobacter sp. SYSU D00535]|uniref:peptidoglycan DD-metalloendopeptidase family protein n=1 Tax=Pedobacter sp. SYSU D00535 TaxID=2810308 RepID=UPI001A95B45E|nr:peptidoglycan DD-metalloendopeptidase family protein [Pedobacter sp. SYSU D00535]